MRKNNQNVLVMIFKSSVLNSISLVACIKIQTCMNIRSPVITFVIK